MKPNKTLRERVARFIRRRREDDFKPNSIATELCRGALAIFVGDDGSEEGFSPRQLLVTKTVGGGVSIEYPRDDYEVQIVPTADSASIQHLTRAFGEMTPNPGEAFRVVIDEDGNGFSVEAVNAKVSPEMVQTALEQAARQFGFYEQQHRAKGTPESDEKASVNHEMKLLMERALGANTYAPVKMGFLPIDANEGGFDVAVEMLVERGYELGVAHDTMMRSLANNVLTIGQCHGWGSDAVVFAGTGDGHREAVTLARLPRRLEPGAPIASDVIVIPTVQDAPETAQESDSALPAPSAPLASAAAILAWLRGKAEYARKRGDTDIQRQLLAICEGIEKDLVDELPIDPETALRQFYKDCHARNVKAGWWNDLATGQPKKRSVGELFVLIVTELAEAYRAYVMGDADDKLPHLPGLGVELGDVQIRLADFCGALLEGSIVEHSGVENPGDAMFREIIVIAERYESIRKTDAAKGAAETGEPIPAQDVAGMTFEKLTFNSTRPDHKIENRLKDDGKRT